LFTEAKSKKLKNPEEPSVDHKGHEEPYQDLADDEILTRHANLIIVGIVGSIDNDMSETDMTIGADTALNHIVRFHIILAMFLQLNFDG
jgi:hypothetical protein